MQMMAERIARSGEPATGPGGSTPRFRGDWYLGVVTKGQTYRNIAYLLLAFPLGVAYFVALVTLLALGGGLAVTVVGIPLLVGVLFAWCYVADLDRRLANALLGTRIPPLSFRNEEGAALGWPRLRARLANPMTWRSLAFLFLRFPLGIASFFLVSALLGLPAQCIGAPILAEIGSGAERGMDFAVFRINHWYEGAILLPLGVVLLPLALHALNGAAYLSGQVARAFLGSGQVDPAATGESIDRAAQAALRWRGLRLGAHLTADESRLQWLQLRVFGWHLSGFFFVALFFVVVNGITTPGTWWSLFVVWGIGFPIAIHAGYLVRGWLGAHIGLFAITNLGLFLIDVAYSDNWWYYWPLLAWLPFVLLHIAIDRHLHGREQPAATATLATRVEPTAEPDAAPERYSELRYDPPAPPDGPSPEHGIRVDEEMRRVTVDGVEVELTPKEFDLIALLSRNPGRPFSRDELLDRIWKNDYEVTDRTVDTHIQRLRKKLGPQSEAIQTVWGVGYRYSG